MKARSIKHSEKPEGKTYPPKSFSQSLQILEAELERLKLKAGMGFEVKLEWLPGIEKWKNGKQLLEEVIGNTIFIYVEDLVEAIPLLAHEFSEWILNQNTKRYRLLINKLIEVFEEIQYEEKERVADAIAKLLMTD